MLVERKVVVHVEGDQPQHANVERDVPPPVHPKEGRWPPGHRQPLDGEEGPEGKEPGQQRVQSAAAKLSADCVVWCHDREHLDKIQAVQQHAARERDCCAHLHLPCIADAESPERVQQQLVPVAVDEQEQADHWQPGAEPAVLLVAGVDVACKEPAVGEPVCVEVVVWVGGTADGEAAGNALVDCECEDGVVDVKLECVPACGAFGFLRGVCAR